MSRYPILVDQWSELHPSDLAVCEKCDKTMRVDPAEGDPYDRCLKHRACGGQIVMKYDEGERCKSCRKLDYSMPRELNGCCSRKCMLQAEYAKSLKEHAS
jgi:hypothetical protein